MIGRAQLQRRQPDMMMGVDQARGHDASRPAQDPRAGRAARGLGAELEQLTKGNKRIGGLAVFVGLVREMHVREGYHRDRVDALTLEHYPGMAEEEISRHVEDAKSRWPLLGVTVIHRYGRIEPGQNIVLVVTASSHREAAFAAAEFLMDYLKTRAPFWKQVESAQGRNWVDAKATDDRAADRWGRSDTKPSNQAAQ